MQQVDQLSTQAYVLMLTALYYGGMAQWNKAEEAAKEGMKIAQYLDHPRFWQQNLAILLSIARAKGEFSGLAKFGELYTSNKLTVQHEEPQLQISSSWARGLVALWLGQRVEAIRLFEAALQMLDNSINRLTKISIYRHLAVAYLRENQAQKAYLVAQKATTIEDKSSPTSYLSLIGLTNAAEVYLTLWEIKAHHLSPEQSLKELAHQACKKLERFSRIFPIGQSAAWRWRGLYNWLAGNPAKAYRAWHKSLVLAKQYTMRYEEGLTYYEIGRHKSCHDPERQAYLTRAIERFSQIGAKDERKRAQVALEQ